MKKLQLTINDANGINTYLLETTFDVAKAELDKEFDAYMTKYRGTPYEDRPDFHWSLVELNEDGSENRRFWWER